MKQRINFFERSGRWPEDFNNALTSIKPDDRVLIEFPKRTCNRSVVSVMFGINGLVRIIFNVATRSCNCNGDGKLFRSQEIAMSAACTCTTEAYRYAVFFAMQWKTTASHCRHPGYKTFPIFSLDFFKSSHYDSSVRVRVYTDREHTKCTG
jgi:hypothetical protein